MLNQLNLHLCISVFLAVPNGWVSLLIGQVLVNGCLSIYETGDNSTAILGQNWATQFNTLPSTTHDLGKPIWEMFWIATDAEKMFISALQKHFIKRINRNKSWCCRYWRV